MCTASRHASSMSPVDLHERVFNHFVFAWPQDWPAHLVWAALVRAAVTCHQRRGDSDAVAHCLYQLLALDLAAPEWDAML